MFWFQFIHDKTIPTFKVFETDRRQPILDSLAYGACNSALAVYFYNNIPGEQSDFGQ